jgi:hypothetical protein
MILILATIFVFLTIFVESTNLLALQFYRLYLFQYNRFEEVSLKYPPVQPP